MMDLTNCDVIIPARNAAATLPQAIASVLSQTETNLRLIVVDDGSDDETPAIVRDFASRDARVTLLSQSGQGISAAMNAGIAAGAAAFIARLDADDIAAPDRIARQLRYLRDNPQVVAVSGAHLEIGADGKPTGRSHDPAMEFTIDAKCAPAAEPPLTQPFFMVRREAILATGGYRPFPVSEDSDLYWRLSEQGRLANMPDILGSYRVHTGSISASSVLNGRLMALCSQLAALSAQRRAARQADIALAVLPRWRDAGRIAPMMARAVADTGVNAAEKPWLRVATAGKLMELAGYRPYELDESDCAFIADALDAGFPGLSAENRADLVRMRTATAARLLRGGQLRCAMRLAPAGLIPQTLLRAATGRLYWTKHLT
jgi:glycosyltransferase involved in cell wall biosynthesis